MTPLGVPGLLQSLHEISLELSTLPDTSSLCRRAVDWALGHLGFDRISLWFIDRSDPDWSLGTWGTDRFGAIQDERHCRVKRDPLVTPREFYQGTLPVIFRQDEVCFDQMRNPLGRADKAMAPLWDGREIIGEIAADNFVRRKKILPHDLDPLVLYARIVAHLYTLFQTREALVRVNEDRGTLLRELRHRTRNNLSVISGLATLEADRTTVPEAKERLEVLRDRVEALGALYSLLDRDEEPNRLRLDEYLTTVVVQLAKAHGAASRGIHVALALDPVEIDAKRASSAGIAVNELLTDCLKYAFAGGRLGTIRVALSTSGSEIQLEVRDDGPGLPQGFDPAESAGLGFGLVIAIARQMGGRFECFSDGGAVFVLRFSA